MKCTLQMCFGSAACEWRLGPAGYCGRGGGRLEAEQRHLVVPVLPVLTAYWVEVRIKLLVWCAPPCAAASELRALDSSLISLAGLNPGGRSHAHQE